MENSKNINDAPFMAPDNWAAQSKQIKAKSLQLGDAGLKFETGLENELFKKAQTWLNEKFKAVTNIFKNINW